MNRSYMNEEHREQLLAIQIKEIQDKLRSNYEQRSFLLILLNEKTEELIRIQSQQRP